MFQTSHLQMREVKIIQLIVSHQGCATIKLRHPDSKGDTIGLTAASLNLNLRTLIQNDIGYNLW